MKTGYVMVISALIMFSGTVTWAAFKEVPRKVYNYEQKKRDIAQIPNKVNAESFFFESKKVAYLYVDVPLPVELDDSFNGVELLGDTSQFQYIKVITKKKSDLDNDAIYVEYNLRPTEASQLWNVSDFDLMDQLSKADIKVRIGIGSNNTEGPSNRDLSFIRCTKISTANPIHDHEFNISLSSTDTVALEVVADKLALSFQNKDRTGRQVQLTGNCERVLIKNFNDGTLDASGLKVKDLYIDACKNAKIHVFASVLARIGKVDNCEVEIDGNPRWKRVEMKE